MTETLAPESIVMRFIDSPVPGPWKDWYVSRCEQVSDGRYHFQVSSRSRMVQLEGWAAVEKDVLSNALGVVRRYHAKGRR